VGHLLDRARGLLDVVYREILKFGAVGAIAFVVDLAVFNLLRTGLLSEPGPLAHKPLTSKTISVAVATVVAWLGNRYWTFRHRRRSAAHHEFAMFVLMNVGGLLIALGCLAFSHYLLDLRSALADNISGEGLTGPHLPGVRPHLPQGQQPVPGQPDLLQPSLVGGADGEQQRPEAAEHHPPR
jgi:putative flippase GtrA